MIVAVLLVAYWITMRILDIIDNFLYALMENLPDFLYFIASIITIWIPGMVIFSVVAAILFFIYGFYSSLLEKYLRPSFIVGSFLLIAYVVINVNMAPGVVWKALEESNKPKHTHSRTTNYYNEEDYGEYSDDSNIHHVSPHYVEGYTRSDGTQVDGYWRGGDDGYMRSNPDGNPYNNLNSDYGNNSFDDFMNDLWD